MVRIRPEASGDASKTFKETWRFFLWLIVRKKLNKDVVRIRPEASRDASKTFKDTNKVNWRSKLGGIFYV